MNRPTAVERLLEELNGEIIESDVETVKSSKMVIFVNEDDTEGFTLTGHECGLVLATDDTAQRLIDCIDRPRAASLVLTDVWPDDEVLGILERGFNAVDEG